MHKTTCRNVMTYLFANWRRHFSVHTDLYFKSRVQTIPLKTAFQRCRIIVHEELALQDPRFETALKNKGLKNAKTFWNFFRVFPDSSKKSCESWACSWFVSRSDLKARNSYTGLK